MKTELLRCAVAALSVWSTALVVSTLQPTTAAPADDAVPGHREQPSDPWMPRPAEPPPGVRLGRSVWVRDGYTSIQVNVDELGNNIPGDAANEPSIAVDPTNPDRIVIGWRQFDTVQSNFRQAGWAYSHDAGQTWTFPGVLEPGVFRSDPVLDADAEGNIYYYSLRSNFTCQLFKSTDGGVSWTGPVPAYGGDKNWMTIDRTDGPGRGHIYGHWSLGYFARSVNGGESFQDLVSVPGSPIWGTSSVGFDGRLYIFGRSYSGSGLVMARSTNAQDALEFPVFEFSAPVDLGGSLRPGGFPNPGGLLGQAWVATDHSNGSTRGNVYALASVITQGDDPLDVMFGRSIDNGVTWSNPVRVNDDPGDTNAWQWFGTMSVAPNGRIDVIWNDTRGTESASFSELYYAWSIDAGMTWSENVAVSPAFNSRIGWPNQSKIGDYYDMVSDMGGAHVAYAATFNNEQDVYYLRIIQDCNGNGIADTDDLAGGVSEDCNANQFPDECEPDCNGNSVADPCDIAAGTSENCNANHVPDECEPDLDGDGAIDDWDDDIDGDGVPNESDICDFIPPGSPVTAHGRHVSDTNGNCHIDLDDYQRFLGCLAAGGPGTPAPAATCLDPFDCDADQDVDIRDFRCFQASFGQ